MGGKGVSGAVRKKEKNSGKESSCRNKATPGRKSFAKEGPNTLSLGKLRPGRGKTPQGRRNYTADTVKKRGKREGSGDCLLETY